MNAALFMGLPTTKTMIQTIPSALLKLFLPYLDEVTVEEHLYLGKWIHEPITLEQLEQIEAHVQSILQKMLPHTSFPPLTCYSLLNELAIT